MTWPASELCAFHELPLLVGDGGCGFQDAAARQHAGGKRDGGGVGLFGDQPGFFGERRIDLLAENIGVGLSLGRLQAEQHGAGFDLLGLLGEDFQNDAAFQMLHRLVIAFHRDLTRGDRRPVERRHRRPDPEAAEHQRDRNIAEHRISAIIGLGRRNAARRRHCSPLSRGTIAC